MLGRIADKNYVDNHQNELIRFSDVDDNHWAYYQIIEATTAHDYQLVIQSCVRFRLIIQNFSSMPTVIYAAVIPKI